MATFKQNPPAGHAWKILYPLVNTPKFNIQFSFVC